MNKNILMTLLIVAIAAAVAVYFDERPPSPRVAMATEDDEPPVLWAGPGFDFVAQDGAQVTQDSLHGSVWIANFVFTQCRSICPTMTAKMVLLHRELAAPQLRFVSFSVDPEHDTPEVLANYAQEWSPGETRWTLLATRPDAIQSVAQGFGVMVMPTDDETDPILHSNRFFLVDGAGMIRGSYVSDDDEAMERLVADAQRLLSKAGANAASPIANLVGPELFGVMGCAGCHNDAQLAPPLAGVFGRTTQLEDGSTVVADSAYVRESIVDPWTRIVAGYRPTMPTYAAILSDTQVDSLVAHLESMQGSNEPLAAATSAVDPVCKMKITVFDDSPSSEFEGERYYFCCEHCQEQFDASPAKFAP